MGGNYLHSGTDFGRTAQVCGFYGVMLADVHDVLVLMTTPTRDQMTKKRSKINMGEIKKAWNI